MVEYAALSVKGRLNHWNLNYNAKKKFSLRVKNPDVNSCDNLHEGRACMINIFQHECWYIAIRNALRKNRAEMHGTGTLTNFVHRWRPSQESEVTMFIRPQSTWWRFDYTGIDFFGPIDIKLLRSTLERGCCAITCLSNNQSSTKPSSAVLGHRVMPWDSLLDVATKVSSSVITAGKSMVPHKNWKHS